MESEDLVSLYERIRTEAIEKKIAGLKAKQDVNPYLSQEQVESKGESSFNAWDPWNGMEKTEQGPSTTTSGISTNSYTINVDAMGTTSAYPMKEVEAQKEVPFVKPLKMKTSSGLWGKISGKKDVEYMETSIFDKEVDQPKPRGINRLSLRKTLVCETCGSDEVAMLKWINVNDKTVEHKEINIPNTKPYCTVCQCETKLIDKRFFNPNAEQEDESNKY